MSVGLFSFKGEVHCILSSKNEGLSSMNTNGLQKMYKLSFTTEIARCNGC